VKSSPKISFFSAGGFSLLELLTVIALVGLLAVLSIPVTQSVLESYRVTQATDLVQGQLSEAKQVAVSLNRPVEVLFCRPLNSLPNTYRLVHSAIVEPGGTSKPLRRTLELPTGICISTKAEWSSLMTLPESAATAASVNLPKIGTQYAYRKIRFYPSGATDLNPVSKWFFTLFNDRNEGQTSLPSNIAVVELDPVNGLTVVTRP